MDLPLVPADPDARDADRIAERIFVGTQVLVAAIGLVLTALGRPVPEMDLERAAAGSFTAADLFVAERKRRKDAGGTP